MIRRLPFYAYSSYNKIGGKQHPTVTRRMNRILDLWAACLTMAFIAEELDIDPDTVRDYIRRARRRGDPRAIRPRDMDRYRLRGSTRRLQIRLLTKAGFSATEIAKRLECSPRLVQIRLKEAANG